MLDANRTNISQWMKDLKELGGEHLLDPKFFFKPCDNSILKHISPPIILATLPTNMRHKFQDHPSSFQIYKAVQLKFNNISQVGQLKVWQQLMSFKLEKPMLTVGAAAKLRE